jgi:hypothetical protein
MTIPPNFSSKNKATATLNPYYFLSILKAHSSHLNSNNKPHFPVATFEITRFELQNCKKLLHVLEKTGKILLKDIHFTSMPGLIQ